MARDVGSAPELPRHVAKEYGLHHEDASVVAVPKKTEEETVADDTSKSSASEASVVDSPETEKAVDEIIAQESDELLRVQDGTPVSTSKPVHRGFWKKIGHFFVRWWRNKWARWITIIILLAVVTAVATIPKMRYAVLNAAGVRSSASVIVLDNTTQLPLKNVTVTLNNQQAQTDIKGVAKLTGLKLGAYKLEIKRIAFAPYSRQVNVGWGSNPLGSYNLQAVGTQYTIMVTDYLSGKPIEGAEAESDQGNALADKTGKIVLTVEDVDVTSLSLRIGGGGYRAEQATLNAATARELQQVLVPDQKTVYVSKQGGKYDVYIMDLDGKNQKVLLPGTGIESSTISLVTSPDNTQAALVSQRENVRDGDGYLLYSLTFINLATGVSTVVDRAQQIVPIDWIGSRLVYRTSIAGASAANAQRNRLVSYNFESNSRIQLATANEFNVALSAKGQIYFAASATDPRATLGLFRIKPDGSNRERLSEQEVWTGLRASYNTLALQVPDGWFTHTLGTKDVVKSAPPAIFESYVFVAHPKGSFELWVDVRDGKGLLLLQNNSDGQNTTLASQVGLTRPMRWVGEKAIVFRVATSSETADYVVSPDGGTARKLADVTPTAGFSQAY
ncbi:MAG: hypothetical protein ABWX94_03105 [Candidatus Saccharimonadales bacterium]